MLVIGALGVVYGDIGTSVLYALNAIFTGEHGVKPSPDNVLGVLSLIFWTLTIIVSLKYVVLILRADNNGEGGTMALMAMATGATHDRPRLRAALIVMGLMGAALFYGDGVITPAVSVLGAMEGLEVATPSLKPYVVPLVIIVLVGLYSIQRKGTGLLGKLFGPITLIWFAVIATMGVSWIIKRPEVMLAVNPLHALTFLYREGWLSLFILGSVFLAVTGAEALYADMGHFGKSPIRIAWFIFVFPALILNYFGQGALLLVDPTAADNPFFKSVPSWGLYPMVGLATLAAVIASQATISGTFSVTKQAVQLGYLPRMQIRHTSVRDVGQIYVPVINWLQLAAVIIAVVGFGSSAALGSAYGIAVTGTMVLTTLLTFFVIRHKWRYPWGICIVATGFFLIVELIFLGANLLKIVSGGWFTLVIAAICFTLLLTWKQGRNLMKRKLRDEAIPLKPFLNALLSAPPTRVEGTAVFLSPEQGVTPSALLHNLKHYKVLHHTNLFVTVESLEVPWITFDKRVQAESLGNDCWRVVLRFGFKNEPDVPRALKLLKNLGIATDEMHTSYFLSRDIVVTSVGHSMAPWREELFASMHRNAGAAADFLKLPVNRVMELGSKIAI